MMKINNKLLGILATVFVSALALSLNVNAQENDKGTITFGQKYNYSYYCEESDTVLSTNDLSYEDTYTLVVPSYGQITLTEKESGHGNIPSCSIYDSTGSRVWYLDMFYTYEKIHRFYMKPGTYKVVVADGIIDEGHEGRYSLLFKFDSKKKTYTHENVFKEDAVTKSPLPFSTKIYGMVPSGAENEWYRVTFPKKGKVTVDLTDYSDSGDYNIYDANGEEIHIGYGKNSGGNLTKTFNVSKGTYYFCATDYNYETTQSGTYYSFKITYSQSPTKTFSVNKTSKTSVRIKANKAGTIKGYEVKYRAGSGKWKTINVKKSSLDKKIKNLKKNKKYQFKIRTYSNDGYGKKLYSDWSKTKTVKL